MNPKAEACRRIEPDLLAAAAREAAPAAARRVEEHVRVCAGCRDEFERYGAIEGAVSVLREAPAAPVPVRVRTSLEARLAELRSRLVRYRIFSSPLGSLLLARSDRGVSLVEYLDPGTDVTSSRLAGSGLETAEDGAGAEALYRDLLDYLEGRRTKLEWPLDFRLARSGFHRRVLEAAAAIPYGAVTSYARIAIEIGQPTATRAVAQALRQNPLPIVVPCHRVIGSSGALVGYAGSRLPLKERLLAVEGVPTVRRKEPRVGRDTMYVTSVGWDEYCLPTCGSLASESLARLTLFASRDRAEASGLGPCGNCRPDLHPLH